MYRTVAPEVATRGCMCVPECVCEALWMQLRYITAKGVSADASQQMYTVHTVTVLVLYPASRKKNKKKGAHTTWQHELRVNHVKTAESDLE